MAEPEQRGESENDSLRILQMILSDPNKLEKLMSFSETVERLPVKILEILEQNKPKKERNSFAYIQEAITTGRKSPGTLPKGSHRCQYGFGDRKYVSIDDLILVGGGLVYRTGEAGDNPDISVTLGGYKGVSKTLKLDLPILFGAQSRGSCSPEYLLNCRLMCQALGIPYNPGEGGVSGEIVGNLDQIISIFNERAMKKLLDKHDLIKKYNLNEDELMLAVQRASGIFGIDIHYYMHNGKEVDIVEIKFGQGAKPNKGGLLPGKKVDQVVAELRRIYEGRDASSPNNIQSIYSVEDIGRLVEFIRHITRNQAIIGGKIALNDVPNDVKVLAKSDVDYITLAGKGGTGAATKLSMRTEGLEIAAGIRQARESLSELQKEHPREYEHVKLVASGGIGQSYNSIIKYLAAGADLVEIGTAFKIAGGCKDDCKDGQCVTGGCPVGIATQNEKLREKYRERQLEHLDNMLAYVNVIVTELKDSLIFLGIQHLNDPVTGKRNLHRYNLRALTAEASRYFGVPHAATGVNYYLHDKAMEWMAGNYGLLIRAINGLIRDQRELLLRSAEQEKRIAEQESRFAKYELQMNEMHRMVKDIHTKMGGN